jgi:hypothetical protein
MMKALQWLPPLHLVGPTLVIIQTTVLRQLDPCRASGPAAPSEVLEVRLKDMCFVGGKYISFNYFVCV